MILAKPEFHALLHATHASPHSALGMHPHQRGRSSGVVVRAFLRDAAECAVVDPATGDAWPMKRLADEGFFEIFVPKRPKVLEEM